MLEVDERQRLAGPVLWYAIVVIAPADDEMGPVAPDRDRIEEGCAAIGERDEVVAVAEIDLAGTQAEAIVVAGDAGPGLCRTARRTRSASSPYQMSRKVRSLTLPTMKRWHSQTLPSKLILANLNGERQGSGMPGKSPSW